MEEFIPGDLKMVQEIVSIMADVERRGEVSLFHLYLSFIVNSRFILVFILL